MLSDHGPYGDAYDTAHQNISVNQDGGNGSHRSKGQRRGQSKSNLDTQRANILWWAADWADQDSKRDGNGNSNFHVSKLTDQSSRDNDGNYITYQNISVSHAGDSTQRDRRWSKGQSKTNYVWGQQIGLSSLNQSTITLVLLH